MKKTQASFTWIIGIAPAFVALPLLSSHSGFAETRVVSRFLVLQAPPSNCPDGWVVSDVPGGCSPGFFTLKFAGIAPTKVCPTGWVRSSIPGGCSPTFFTLQMNGTRDNRYSCPQGWVRSSAPGGCSPEYLSVQLTGIKVIDHCPDGWIRSSAPGGCSPDNFTLEPGFDGIDRAYFHCAFGDSCQPMIDAVLALGGTCVSDGPDTSCRLPPPIPED